MSKEILPIGQMEHVSGEVRPRPVTSYLLESLAGAGVTSSFLVLAPGKWDIAEELGSGRQYGVRLAYLVRNLPFGVPFTLDSAYSFTRHASVAFGFPDIIFTPPGAMAEMVSHQMETDADVILGAFPVSEPSQWDALVVDGNGNPLRIAPKPHRLDTGLTWILALWTPVFGQFMHDFVENWSDEHSRGLDVEEVSLGAVFQSALEHGLAFHAVVFDDGFCVDVGTPEGLALARQRFG
jgi:glucose-1-phosphate thymidylyltransferase